MKINPNSEILVLSTEGTNLGRMAYRDALTLAMEQNLDLVNVNRADGVEVFKIMDHGKWKYDKKKHKQKKTQQQLKEMNFKLCIDSHDLYIKIDRIESFLKKGHDVKIAVTLRGREKNNPRQAYDKLDEILKKLEGKIQVQQRKESPSMAFAVVRNFKQKSDGKKRSLQGDHEKSRQTNSTNGRNGDRRVCNNKNTQVTQISKIDNSGSSASNERRITV